MCAAPGETRLWRAEHAVRGPFGLNMELCHDRLPARIHGRSRGAGPPGPAVLPGRACRRAMRALAPPMRAAWSRSSAAARPAGRSSISASSVRARSCGSTCPRPGRPPRRARETSGRRTCDSWAPRLSNHVCICLCPVSLRVRPGHADVTAKQCTLRAGLEKPYNMVSARLCPANQARCLTAEAVSESESEKAPRCTAARPEAVTPCAADRQGDPQVSAPLRAGPCAQRPRRRPAARPPGCPPPHCSRPPRAPSTHVHTRQSWYA